MRRADLRRRARAAIRQDVTVPVLCLGCGLQGEIEGARPAERWTCPQCGRRELVRDYEEAERPARAEREEGEA